MTVTTTATTKLYSRREFSIHNVYIQIGKENRRKYYESYIKTGEMRDTVITKL